MWAVLNAFIIIHPEKEKLTLAIKGGLCTGAIIGPNGDLRGSR